MSSDGSPANVGSNDGLGLLPERTEVALANLLEQQFKLGVLSARNPRPSKAQCTPAADAVREACAAIKEVHECSLHLHRRNTALMLLVSDLGDALGRMVAGMDHLDKLAREWEPDHSSGADRASWVRAKDACAEAMRLMADIPGRLKA